jgi:tRNA (cmo5U34)-methyltransferase
MTQRLIEANYDHCTDASWYGIEIADGFQDDLVKREDVIYKFDPNAWVYFEHEDIRDTEIHNASLVTSIFTLQFMPKRDRKQVIKNIYHGLNCGGAFIFSEKTICENATFQDMLTFNYYDYKRKSFDTEDIMNKERTLRHMMKPNTWNELTDMIYNAGFKDVQPFWRNHMFVGAIAVK